MLGRSAEPHACRPGRFLISSGTSPRAADLPRCGEKGHNSIAFPDRLDRCTGFDHDTSKLVAHDEAGPRWLVAAKHMELTGRENQQSEDGVLHADAIQPRHSIEGSSDTYEPQSAVACTLTMMSCSCCTTGHVRSNLRPMASRRLALTAGQGDPAPRPYKGRQTRRLSLSWAWPFLAAPRPGSSYSRDGY